MRRHGRRAHRSNSCSWRGSASPSISAMSSATGEAPISSTSSAVLTAAAANTLMLQTFDLYSVPALQRLRQELHPHRRRLDAGRGRADGWSPSSARSAPTSRACGSRPGTSRRSSMLFGERLARLAARQALDPRGAAQPPRRDRRRRARGGGADQGARGLARHRHPHRRHLRRSRQRIASRPSSPAIPSSAISMSWWTSRANSRLDLLIVSLPVTAEKRLLQLLKKLWVLPVDIRLSAHNNQLRFRPRTYSYIGNVPFIDVTDKPIADWDHVKKWLFDKIAASARADPARAGDGGDRAAHQARLEGPGAVPPEAAGLQQRADRGLQIPLDVCRPGRRRREQARHQGRSARHPRRPLPAQDEPR